VVLGNLFVFDSRLLENAVSGMSGLDIVIDREFSVVDRAIRDFMIAFAGPIKAAFLIAQDLLDLIGIASHLRRFRQAYAFLPLLRLTVEAERNVELFIWIYRALI
jgi:hypothetical protein